MRQPPAAAWTGSPSHRRTAIDDLLAPGGAPLDALLDTDGVLVCSGGGGGGGRAGGRGAAAARPPPQPSPLPPPQSEIKAGYPPLMTALAERVAGLVELVASPAAATDTAARRYRRPFAALEALAAAPASDAMADAVVGGGGVHLMALVGALAGPAEPHRAPRLARALAAALAARPKQVLAWMSGDPDARLLILATPRALACAAAAETVARLGGADPGLPLPADADAAWVADCGLLERLADVAASGEGASDAAAAVLTAAARAPPSSALGAALAASVPAVLAAAASAPPAAGARLVRALGALLEPGGCGECGGGAGGDGPCSPPAADADAAETAAAARVARGAAALAPVAAALVALLGSGESGAAPVDTPCAPPTPPFGPRRLAAADVLASLVASVEEEADGAALAAAAAPAALVAALVSRPHHTILHALAAAGLAAAVTAGPATIAAAVAGEGSGAVAACARAPRVVPGRPRARSHEPSLVRASYGGALTELGAALAAAEGARPEVAAALAAQPDWRVWRDSELAAALAARGPVGWETRPPEPGGAGMPLSPPRDLVARPPPASPPRARAASPPVADAARRASPSPPPSFSPSPSPPPDSWEDAADAAAAAVAGVARLGFSDD